MKQGNYFTLNFLNHTSLKFFSLLFFTTHYFGGVHLNKTVQGQLCKMKLQQSIQTIFLKVWGQLRTLKSLRMD